LKLDIQSTLNIDLTLFSRVSIIAATISGGCAIAPAISDKVEFGFATMAFSTAAWMAGLWPFSSNNLTTPREVTQKLDGRLASLRLVSIKPSPSIISRLT